MTDEYFDEIPDNKVMIVKVETFADDWAVNNTILNEYKIGWIVQQIVYLEHIQSVMILFKRKG